MLRFNQLNMNPKGRKTGDCSTRAISYALGITWDEALRLQFEESLKTKYDPSSRQVTERILAKYGFVKMKQPRKLDNTKYVVKEFDKVLSSNARKNRIVCNVANHYVVVDGDHYVDTWDSGYKTVGNYYMKIN